MHSIGRLLLLVFCSAFDGDGCPHPHGRFLISCLAWIGGNVGLMRRREMFVDESEYLPKEDGNGGQKIYISNRLLKSVKYQIQKKAYIQTLYKAPIGNHRTSLLKLWMKLYKSFQTHPAGSHAKHAIYAPLPKKSNNYRALLYVKSHSLFISHLEWQKPRHYYRLQ